MVAKPSCFSRSIGHCLPAGCSGIALRRLHCTEKALHILDTPRLPNVLDARFLMFCRPSFVATAANDKQTGGVAVLLHVGVGRIEPGSITLHRRTGNMIVRADR